jgi:tetratricopeptide (TPR) repeat protein
MHELEKIPGNTHSIEKLRLLFENKRSLAFVGAGASAGLYPLWKELITRLSNEAIDRGLANSADRDFWLSNANNSPSQVVKGIKNALGSNVYGSILYKLFSPKFGPNGKNYTHIHEAIVKLNFRGIITTNYDPGLIEARHSERNDIITTGFSTWQDGDDLQRWLTGEIYTSNSFPILFSHGIYQRSDTIVLGIDEYRDAYQPGLYRRLFEKLWSQDNLVFIGFSFSDNWIRFVSDEVLSQFRNRSASEPRHVAFIGLNENDSYSPEFRRFFYDSFNSDVIFYPVNIISDGKEDHSELFKLLKGYYKPQVFRTCGQKISQTKDKFQDIKFVHETTNDDKFTGREFSIERLNRWAKDPDVKAIGLTGMGGQGKTALIGHWLKNNADAWFREYEHLYFWSFYVNRSIKDFLISFLKFMNVEIDQEIYGLTVKNRRKKKGAKKTIQSIPLFKIAIKSLKSTSVILALDGLEVIQERPGTSAYGTLLEDELRYFLDDACRIEHNSMVVLTSRFPFSDLTCFIGSGLRILDLEKLTLTEGAKLLEKCKVKGKVSDREAIVKLFEGHPLALRIFAAALSTQSHGDPSRLCDIVFNEYGLNESDPLEGKLLRLLKFYESQLPELYRLLLRTVSLFRYPIEEKIVLTLSRGQIIKNKNAKMRDGNITNALKNLKDDGLLLKENIDDEIRYSCHPILRDHFRLRQINKDLSLASEAAFLLTSRPAENRPTDVKEIIPFLDAIELLIDANYYEDADNLYQDRLSNGELFFSIPAAHEGRRCALFFVSNGVKREYCLEDLSYHRLIWYLNSVAVFSNYTGEPLEAIQYIEYAIELNKNYADYTNHIISLRNYASTLTLLGRLDEAENYAKKAVELTISLTDDFIKSTCLSELGYIACLKGNINQSLNLFKEAFKHRQEKNEAFSLSSMWKIKHAEVLLMLEKHARCSTLIKNTLSACRNRQWLNDVAGCFRILGNLYCQECKIEDANDLLLKAEKIFRNGHMLAELSLVLQELSIIHYNSDELEQALILVEEALRISLPRRLLISQIKALIIRSKIWRKHSIVDTNTRDSSFIYRALDDAEGALGLSRKCSFKWGEKDATKILADLYKRLGKDNRSKKLLNDYNEIVDKLKPKKYIKLGSK